MAVCISRSAATASKNCSHFLSHLLPVTPLCLLSGARSGLPHRLLVSSPSLPSERFTSSRSPSLSALACGSPSSPASFSSGASVFVRPRLRGHCLTHSFAAPKGPSRLHSDTLPRPLPAMTGRARNKNVCCRHSYGSPRLRCCAFKPPACDACSWQVKSPRIQWEK